MNQDYKIIQGDCLEKLKELEDNSVDSVVTDPPYGLSFMGKKWDYDVPSTEVWGECLRVLKPGGHLLAFSGTRTYHRMAVAIEDAGFEVRDMIEWVYGSGFPKSLNVGKQVNKLETDEWSNISKAFDNVDQKSIMEVWKSNAKLAGIKLSKNLTGVGSSMQKKYFVPDIAVLYPSQENKNASVIIAELNSCVLNHTSEESLTIAVESVEQNTELSQDLAKSVIKLSQSHGVSSWSIFTAQCDVKEWLNENTEANHKVDEALKTLRGNKKYSNEEITSVLCAGLTDILKLTILNQSKTFQNLDTKSQTDFLSAINVIITEYTAENLISNTVAILKSKTVDKLQGNEREEIGRNPNSRENCDKSNTLYESGTVGKTDILTKGTSRWEGWGTALKPAHEPIVVARKPLGEKTVAENCLKWGVGGINIDGCRVEAPKGDKFGGGGLNSPVNGFMGNTENTYKKGTGFRDDTTLGRFPANLIHDGSEEVIECFPETKTGAVKKTVNNGSNQPINLGGGLTKERPSDSGNASRFFKSIIYQAKSSKSERTNGGTITNSHPTIKPIALMEYLIKMVTPKGGIVLDPFAGSGSTLVAAKQNGYKYIGIEMTAEYIPIIEARLNSASNTLFQ